jgi:hypothetical protein
MYRPKSTRMRRLTIRLNDNELTVLHELAEQVEMTIASYIRWRLIYPYSADSAKPHTTRC